MLDALIAAFVDRASEREFDPILLAILRKRGFTHVSFTHGAFEFGQDVTARLQQDGCVWQYGIQSKAGDVAAKAWRTDLKPQLEQIVEKQHLHGPAFDPTLPRRAVAVVTGIFKGSAALEAEEYRRNALETHGVDIEFWDRERIIEFLVGAPDAVIPRPRPDLVVLLGQLMAGTADTLGIERLSRTWLEDDNALLEGAVEAAVLVHYATESHRVDLACHIACCLFRAGVWGRSVELASAGEILEAARRLIVGTASTMLDFPLNEAGLMPMADGPAAFVTYPVRALRFAEYLSLLILLGDQEVAERAESAVRGLVESEPGAAHPLSDRWAPSIANTAVALGASYPDLVSTWIRDVARWVADRREFGLGLAPYNATPREEVDQLLGSALEHVDAPKRTDSTIATLLLDLALALEDEVLLDDLLTEWQAVALSAPAVEYDTLSDACRLTASPHLHPNVVSFGYGNAGSWAPVHHGDDLVRGDPVRAAELMVVATVTRDRHFPAALATLIGRGGKV